MQDKTPREPARPDEKPAVPTTDELDDHALDSVTGGAGAPGGGRGGPVPRGG
jgi:hypothetical protein